MSILESSANLRGGVLSSSCGGLEPFGPKGDFARQTDERTTGLRDLDGYKSIGVYEYELEPNN